MRTTLITTVTLISLCLTGCQWSHDDIAQTSPTQPTVQELQHQPTPDTVRIAEDLPPPTTVHDATTALYRGSAFDISYPRDFHVKPFAPQTYNDVEYTDTDEAYFTAPDNSVEFYVFSPLWTGEPEYAKLGADEILVDQREEGSKTEYGNRITRWVTIKARDGSYFRSFVSIRDILEGSEMHHVFGIRYKNDIAYSLYKNAYLEFKKSLRQYAD